MAAYTPLFTAAELAEYLQYPVADADGLIAERVAWGWLMPALGLDARPDPVPDDVFAWALELGAIAHETPNGAVTATSTGATTDTYGAPRRQQILAEAARRVSGGFSAGGPQGAFPPPRSWPDAVEAW